jgi:hypothetical protein
MNKIMYILCFTFFFVCAVFAQTESKNSKLLGTWLLIWNHGITEVTVDGKLEKMEMFSPNFHAFVGDFQSETYLKLNGDGTGVYFTRDLLKNKIGTFDGVERVIDNKTKAVSYNKKNKLSEVITFNWKLSNSNIHIDQTLKGYLGSQIRDYEFILNEIPTKKSDGLDFAEFKLQDELIIKNIGQFRRIGNNSLLVKILGDYSIK